MLELIAQKIFPHLPIKPRLRCIGCLSLVPCGIKVCDTCFQGYDKFVMLSGGKDSAYILNQLRGTNVLAIFVDTGFVSKKVLENVRFCAKATNTSLLILDQYRHIFHDRMKKALLDLKGKPCYEHLDGVEGDLIFSLVGDLARRYNKQMVCGLSKLQLEEIFNIGTGCTFIDKGVVFECPLAQTAVSEDYIKSYVEDFKLLKYSGPLQTNSDLILLMAILDIKNLGYSSFEKEFSRGIRLGTSDRQYWVNMFDFIYWVVNKGWLDGTANRLLKRFDLTLKDVL